MDKITISSGVKKIQVNDSRECITFDTRDQGFLAEMVALTKYFEAKRPEYQAKLAEIEAMPSSTQEEQIARAAAACDFNMKVCEHLKQQVDNIFHDEVCRKVFGNITPTVDVFAEFFLQLAPIVRIAQMERQEKVRKYTDKYRRGE